MIHRGRADSGVGRPQVVKGREIASASGKTLPTAWGGYRNRRDGEHRWRPETRQVPAMTLPIGTAAQEGACSGNPAGQPGESADTPSAVNPLPTSCSGRWVGAAPRGDVSSSSLPPPTSVAAPSGQPLVLASDVMTCCAMVQRQRRGGGRRWEGLTGPPADRRRFAIRTAQR